MATSILWYQPAKLTDDDFIFLNGKSLSNTSDRSEAFDKLKKVSDKVIGKDRPWCGNVSGYFFVKGTLNEKDERGRKLSFTFMSDEADGEAALHQTLKAASKVIDNSTAACIKEYPVRREKAKKMAIGIAAVCILIIIIALLAS